MEESRQSGFSLIGVLAAVVIIGIMATLAVPRFTAMLATANTAKIQSDLSTLDAAIALYQLEQGTTPSSIDQLSPYINNIGNLKPPTGKCQLVKEGLTTIKAKAYMVTTVTDSKDADGGTRATCDGYKAEDFGHGASNAGK